MIVYLVEWYDGDELKSEWFSVYESAVRFAKKVGGIISEKDVS